MPGPPGSAAFCPFLVEISPAHKSPLPPQPLTPSCRPKRGCCPALWSHAASRAPLGRVEPAPAALTASPTVSLASAESRGGGGGKWEVEANHTVFIVHSFTNVQNKNQTIKGKNL